MSVRPRKSALEAFREVNGNVDAASRRTSLSRTSLGQISVGQKSLGQTSLGQTSVVPINSKQVNGNKTPAKIGLPEEEKKKQSSLKKIKKFLSSHSKKKLVISEPSPMVEQPKAAAATVTKKDKLKRNYTDMSADSDKTAKKHRLSGICAGSPIPTLKPQGNAQKQDSMMVKKSKKDGHQTFAGARSASASKISALAGSDDEPEETSRPSKRPRLSVHSIPPIGNSARKTAKQDSEQDVTSDLRWWSPSLNEVCSNSSVCHDSQEDAKKLFEAMIQPVAVSKFFKEIWEKKPLLVRRHNEDYNSGWFSTSDFDEILRHEKVMFGEHVDIVTYVDGKRETHNPAGRAYPAVVWDFYQQGCSVRLLNPQTYSKDVWKILSVLQEYFGCVAGANVYLTPAGTQGFAPHYDDIEAFILQLEGKKRWKVYEPRNESETLPRFSSPNYTEADLSEPVLDAILEPGDLLYFPRGYIHQGSTQDDVHSLHITISVGQKNTWGDLLEKLLPRALEVAMEEEVDLRRSLPCDYLNYTGVAFSDENGPERQKFLRTVERLMVKVLEYAPVDAACDQMAKRFLEDSLPPALSEAEEQCCIRGSGEFWHPEHQRVSGSAELEPDTEIKIIRRGCLRLVSEEKVSIYHNLDNARVYHGAQSQCFEVDPDEAEAVEFLIKNYPDYVPVEALPLGSLQKQMELVNSLYDRGLLMTKVPLEPIDGDDDSCCDSA